MTVGSVSDHSAPDQHRGAQVSPLFIGREDLLALARRRLADATGGSGGVLFLAGEAGIGKTRLLQEICSSAAATGYTVLRAAAFPRDAEVPGGVLLGLVAELRRSRSTETFGRQIADSPDHTDGRPPANRRRLVSELTETFLTICADPAPTLLALEDLHWADDSTLEVLERMSPRLTALHVLMVGTYRTDELYPHVPLRSWRTRMLTQRLAEEVRLPRLTADQTAAMSEAIRSGALPSTVTGAVFDRSDGIPLHVEEFLSTIGGAGSSDVPDTLSDAVLSRAAVLTEKARNLADVASVLGRSFDLDLLTAITGLTFDEVDEGLRELTDRFIVTGHSDGVTFDFRHALIRDALYTDLAPHRRRSLHAGAADAAVDAGFAEAFLSDQNERARRPALAYRQARVAAAEAAALSAHREAVQLYRRAQRTVPTDVGDAERAELMAVLAAELAAIDDNTAAADAYGDAHARWTALGDARSAAGVMPAMVAVRHLLGAGLAERVGLLRRALISLRDDPDPAVELRLLAAMTAAYMLDRRLEEALATGDRARTVAATHPDAVDAATTVNIDASVGSVLLFAGRLDQGRTLLERAITRAQEFGEEAEAARSYRMLGTSASVLVEYELAEHWLVEGIDFARRTERFNDLHYMTAHLAHVRWATGDWAGADRLARSALANSSGVTTRIVALHVLGYLAVGHSDAAEARRLLAEAAELGAAMRELQRVSPAWWGLAETALHIGDTGAAVEFCNSGLAASAEVHDAAYLFPFVVTGVRAYLAHQDPAGARGFLERCTLLLEERSVPGTLGALRHAEGLLQVHDGQTGKARESLAVAAAFWNERNRFWEGTLALLDQARCAQRSRRPVDAAQFVAEAGRRATLAGCAALADAADRFRPSGVDPTTTLTPRESEVARLVATGATNREIAATLFIAPKTVAAHVEHILAKLGASRRAQIATWSATRD